MYFLLATESTVNWISILDRYGLPTVFLAGLLWLIYKGLWNVGSFLKEYLFDQENGYLIRVLRHLQEKDRREADQADALHKMVDKERDLLKKELDGSKDLFRESIENIKNSFQEKAELDKTLAKERHELQSQYNTKQSSEFAQFMTTQTILQQDIKDLTNAIRSSTDIAERTRNDVDQIKNKIEAITNAGE